MKKFLTILLSGSLALAANALAQQDEEQQKQQKGHGQGHAEHAQQSGTAAQTNENQKGRGHHARAQGNVDAAGQQAATTQTDTSGNRGRGKGKGKHSAEVNASASPTTTGTTDTAADTTGKGQGKQGRKGRHARGENAAANATASPAPANATQSNTANAQAPNQAKANAKKLDPQKVQTIKSQHASFKAQPKPDKVPAVTFNQNYRIQGAESWQGPQYSVFRSYHPEIHDRSWYHSHYSRVELIGGGYYYWNNGYWFPAWGYDPGAQYYAWDGPIYVGHHATPPDQVIANVQAALQEEGYYRGEVDGLLGPLTREALTAYQADHGLYTTAAIDEPTLDSLGMS